MKIFKNPETCIVSKISKNQEKVIHLQKSKAKNKPLYVCNNYIFQSTSFNKSNAFICLCI